MGGGSGGDRARSPAGVVRERGLGQEAHEAAFYLLAGLSEHAEDQLAIIRTDAHVAARQRLCSAACQADVKIQSHGMYMFINLAENGLFTHKLNVNELITQAAAAMRKHPSERDLHVNAVWLLGCCTNFEELANEQWQARGYTLDTILKALQSFADDATIQMLGMWVMGNITGSSHRLLPAVERETLKLAAAAQRNHHNDANVLSAALGVLGQLAAHPDHLELVVELNLMAQLGTTLKQHLDSVRVQEAGLYMLANLTDEAANQGMLPEALGTTPSTGAAPRHKRRMKPILAGAVQMTLASMRAHPKHTSVVANGLGVLGNLASDPDIRREVVSEDCSKLAVDALRNFKDHTEAVGNALALLANISSDTTFRKDLCKGDVVLRLVMNALQRHATAAHVQTSGLILVGHLTDRPGDDLPSISLGQVQKVAQSALKQHVVTQEVRDAGLYALRRVTNDTSSIETAAQSGALQTAVQALQVAAPAAPGAAGASDAALEKQIQTLASITGTAEGRTRVVAAGAVSLIVSTMRDRLRHPGIQIAGMSALTQLTDPSANPAHKVTVATDGGLMATVSALKAHPKTEAVLMAAVWLVSNMREYLAPSHLNVLAAPSILSSLINMLKDHGNDPTVQARGLALLGGLTENMSYIVPVVNAGGVSLAVAAMKRHNTSATLMGAGLSLLANITEEEQYLKVVKKNEGGDLANMALIQHPKDAYVQSSALWLLGNLPGDEWTEANEKRPAGRFNEDADEFRSSSDEEEDDDDASVVMSEKA